MSATSARSIKTKSAIFYAGCAIVLAVMATHTLNHFLPARFSHEINDESEAFPIAILFCAYVQYLWQPVTHRTHRTRSPWPLAIGLAVLSWLIAWLLLALPFTSTIKTLNECFVAIGVMILYACLPRPLPWAPVLTVVMLVFIVALNSTHFVTTQAESLVPLALMPIAFDWADRTILDPTAEDTPVRRIWWCVFLVAIPVLARLHIDMASMHDVLRYERRSTEGIVALLLIHLYFSYWLGSDWRGRFRQSRDVPEKQAV